MATNASTVLSHQEYYALEEWIQEELPLLESLYNLAMQHLTDVSLSFDAFCLFVYTNSKQPHIDA